MVLKGESQKLTAFNTPRGLYKWTRLPMGLASAPGAFQKLMEFALSDLSYQVVLVYLDDIVVCGKRFEEHLLRSEQVFARLEENSLKMESSDRKTFQRRIHVLGQVVQEKGVVVDLEILAAVEKLKSPSNLKKSRAVPGLGVFYSKFTSGFGTTSDFPHLLLKNE